MTEQESIRAKFAEAYGKSAPFRRVPLDESPEEVINSIDPELTYDNWQWDQASNNVYRVLFQNKPHVLKVVSAPGRINAAFHEAKAFDICNSGGVEGVPQIVRAYNWGMKQKYDNTCYSASLREFIPGRPLEEVPWVDAYPALETLAMDLAQASITLPHDMKEDQYKITDDGKAHVLDLEEVRIGGRGTYRANREILREMNNNRGRDDLIGRLEQIPLIKHFATSLAQLKYPYS